jgi:hypothetical protein
MYVCVLSMYAFVMHAFVFLYIYICPFMHVYLSIFTFVNKQYTFVNICMCVVQYFFSVAVFWLPVSSAANNFRWILNHIRKCLYIPMLNVKNQGVLGILFWAIRLKVSSPRFPEIVAREVCKTNTLCIRVQWFFKFTMLHVVLDRQKMSKTILEKAIFFILWCFYLFSIFVLINFKIGSSQRWKFFFLK